MMISIELIKSNKPIGKLIRFFGKMQTGDAQFDHVRLLIDDKYMVEETFLGLRVNDIHYKDIVKAIRYKPLFLRVGQQVEIEKAALKGVGTMQGNYGYLKIPMFALDAMFHTYWFTSHVGIQSFKVCSQWVCWLLYRQGFEPFKTWRNYSPDLLGDYCEAHPDDFLRLSITRHQ